MIPLLTFLAVVAPKSDPDVATLKQAYAQAQKYDWRSQDGKQEVWRLMGSALARVMADWPLQDLGYKRLQIRIERLGVQAGIVDREKFPKRSLLSTRGLKFARVRGLSNGIVVIFSIDRPSRLGQADSDALLLIEGKGKSRKVSLLRADFGESLPLPTQAIWTKGGLLLSGVDGWYGNGPRPSLTFFSRLTDRWAYTSSTVASFQTFSQSGLVKHNGGYSCTSIGTAYPINLNTSHASAQVIWAGRFIFNGSYVYKQERRVPCPMGTLDDLIGAMMQSEEARVSALCPDKGNREKLKAACSKLNGKPPSVEVAYQKGSNTFTSESLELEFTMQKSSKGWRLARLKRYTVNR